MKVRYDIIQFLNSRDCPLPEGERIDLINIYNSAATEHGGAEGVLRILKEHERYAEFREKLDRYRIER